MSATSILPVPEIPMNGELQQRKTTGLVDAVVQLHQLHEDLVKLEQLEKDAARQILNKMDSIYEPSEERRKLRREILDALAWYRRETASWLEHQSLQTLE